MDERVDVYARAVCRDLVLGWLHEAADAALGVAWKDVPTPDNAGDTKQSTGRRRGRRRDRG